MRENGEGVTALVSEEARARDGGRSCAREKQPWAKERGAEQQFLSESGWDVKDDQPLDSEPDKGVCAQCARAEPSTRKH